MGTWRERDSDAFTQTLQTPSSGRIYLPMDGPLDSRLLARFLGKVGVEIMAERLIRANLAPEELLGGACARCYASLRSRGRRAAVPADQPSSHLWRRRSFRGRGLPVSARVHLGKGAGHSSKRTRPGSAKSHHSP